MEIKSQMEVAITVDDNNARCCDNTCSHNQTECWCGLFDKTRKGGMHEHGRYYALRCALCHEVFDAAK